MNKLFLRTSLLLASIAIPVKAEESKSFYLSVGGGIDFIGDIESSVGAIDGSYDTDNPFSYSFAIGKEFDDWRWEFNYSASKVLSDSTTVTVGGNGVTADIAPDLELETKSFMLYGIKDFPGETKLTTYLRAGLGFFFFKYWSSHLQCRW